MAPGQIYEVKAAASLLDTLKNVLLVGNKGSDDDALREKLLDQGCVWPAFHRDRGGVLHLSIIGAYRQRHKIENFFQRIKVYKRISTRYEKLALTFLNFILVAAVFDWLKSM